MVSEHVKKIVELNDSTHTIYWPENIAKNPSNLNNVWVSWHFQNVKIWLIYRPEEKTLKKVATGCKGSFCRCKNIQISLLLEFPIMSDPVH